MPIQVSQARGDAPPFQAPDSVPAASQAARPSMRAAGLVYLVIIVTGLFSELAVRGSLVVPGDPAATLAALTGAPARFRAGIASDTVMVVADATLAILLYAIFKPADPRLSLASMVFQLVMTAMLAAGLILPLTAIDLALSAAPGTPDMSGTVLALLDVHADLYRLALVFFGVHCVLLGLLVIRTRTLPAWLGVTTALAGLGYVADFALALGTPALAAALEPVTIGVAAIGEILLCAWLIMNKARPADAGRALAF